jgi:aspartyl-tRNA(Asn)/glutamyl-tRNA(Gln) amidotransferase subunit A
VETPDFGPSWASTVGLKIGVPREYRVDGMPAEIDSACGNSRRGPAARRGLRDRRGVSAAYEHALPAYYIVAPAEGSSNLARYDGMRFGLRPRASR